MHLASECICTALPNYLEWQKKRRYCDLLHPVSPISQCSLLWAAVNHGNPRLALRLFPVPAEVALSFSPQGRVGSRCGAWLLELSGAILVAAATLASAAVMTEQMTLRGTLKGHNGWVTQIATTPQFPDMILSASRGTGCVPGKTPGVLGTTCLRG